MTGYLAVSYLAIHETSAVVDLDLLCSVPLRFAVATAEELVANSDDCAICWDTMQTARKLPCGHLFHK